MKRNIIEAMNAIKSKEVKTKEDEKVIRALRDILAVDAAMNEQRVLKKVKV